MLGNRLSVTLVGPEYPVNVGHTARLLKNFGIRQLYLVEPRFDKRVAQVYASHAEELIERARIVDLVTVRRSHDLLVATTAIKAVRTANVNRLTVPPEEAAEYIAASSSASLVFGRDTTGLRNEELGMCDIATTIWTGTPYNTLNVSHSLAILLYLASRRRGRKMFVPSKAVRRMFSDYAFELATVSGLQGYKAHKLKQLSKKMSLKSQLGNKEMAILVSLMRKAITTIMRERNQNRSNT